MVNTLNSDDDGYFAQGTLSVLSSSPVRQTPSFPFLYARKLRLRGVVSLTQRHLSGRKVANSADWPGMVLVLARRVPHPRKPSILGKPGQLVTPEESEPGLKPSPTGPQARCSHIYTMPAASFQPS